MTAQTVTDKRILMLFPHMVRPGGGLNYTLRLAELLQSRGAKVGIATMRYDRGAISVPDGVDVLSAEGPLTASLTFWLLFPFWQRRLTSLIDAWQPDLIFPQVFPANWWGWLYRRQSALPLIWMCQEPSAFIHSDAWVSALQPRWKKVVAQGIRPLLKSIDLYLSKNTDMVFANSRFTATELKRVYGLDAAGVANPGIDTLLYHPDNSPRADAIVTVAALTRFKRIDFLIKVFARLLQSYPSLSYHIIGKGDDEASLRTLADQLGIRDRVIFHGKLDAIDLVSIHRTSLLFLHGAIDEPFGMAPLEAIACGTPVIAHNSGGPAEFVTESSGRLIDSKSEDEWVRQISRFLDYLKSNPGYFAEVSDTAINFTWDTTLQPIMCGVEKMLHDCRQIPVNRSGIM
jgi:glycosyltransferase involved in cell wall biosynthesis